MGSAERLQRLLSRHAFPGGCLHLQSEVEGMGEVSFCKTWKKTSTLKGGSEFQVDL